MTHQTNDLGLILQWIQLGTSAFMLLGGAFTLGRLFERLANMKNDIKDIEVKLNGEDGKGGVYLTRAEANLMFMNADRARGDFDTRLTDLSSRVGGIEGRLQGGWRTD